MIVFWPSLGHLSLGTVEHTWFFCYTEIIGHCCRKGVAKLSFLLLTEKQVALLPGGGGVKKAAMCWRLHELCSSDLQSYTPRTICGDTEMQLQLKILSIRDA